MTPDTDIPIKVSADARQKRLLRWRRLLLLCFSGSW